jgi:hypothetical protein
MVDLTRVKTPLSLFADCKPCSELVSEYVLTSYVSSDPGLLTCFRLPQGWVLAALGSIRMAAAGFIGLYLKLVLQQVQWASGAHYAPFG